MGLGTIQLPAAQVKAAAPVTAPVTAPVAAPQAPFQGKAAGVPKAAAPRVQNTSGQSKIERANALIRGGMKSTDAWKQVGMQKFGTNTWVDPERGVGLFIGAKDLGYSDPGSILQFYGYDANPAAGLARVNAQWAANTSKNDVNMKSHMAKFLNQQGTSWNAASDQQKLDSWDYAYREEGRKQQTKGGGFLDALGSIVKGALPAIAGSLVLPGVGTALGLSSVTPAIGGAVGGALAGGIKDGALGAALGGLGGYGTGATVGNLISPASAAASAAAAPVVTDMYPFLPASYGARASTVAGALAQPALSNANIAVGWNPQAGAMTPIGTDILNRSVTSASLLPTSDAGGLDLITRLGQTANQIGMPFDTANALITGAVQNTGANVPGFSAPVTGSYADPVSTAGSAATGLAKTAAGLVNALGSGQAAPAGGMNAGLSSSPVGAGGGAGYNPLQHPLGWGPPQPVNLFSNPFASRYL